MSVALAQFSEDQADAFDRIAEALQSAGVDIEESLTTPRSDDQVGALAVIGKAGSGKTMLLARLAEALTEAGVDLVSGDWEGKRRKRVAQPRCRGDDHSPDTLHAGVRSRIRENCRMVGRRRREAVDRGSDGCRAGQGRGVLSHEPVCAGGSGRGGAAGIGFHSGLEAA